MGNKYLLYYRNYGENCIKINKALNKETIYDYSVEK